MWVNSKRHSQSGQIFNLDHFSQFLDDTHRLQGGQGWALDWAALPSSGLFHPQEPPSSSISNPPSPSSAIFHFAALTVFFNLTSSLCCSRPSCSVWKLFRLLSGDEEQVLRILNNISTRLIVIYIRSCRQNFTLSKFTLRTTGLFSCVSQWTFGQKFVQLHSYTVLIELFSEKKSSLPAFVRICKFVYSSSFKMWL